MPEALTQIPEGNRKDAGLGADAAFWSFTDVQDRLVEAHGFLCRLPDRERGWLRTKTMTIWERAHATAGMSPIEKAEYRRYRAGEPPRMPGLTRDEIGRMNEALAWVDWIKPETRKVVALAIGQLATGRATRIAWGSLASDPTLPGSAERLRKAYGRAINAICVRLNMAEKSI